MDYNEASYSKETDAMPREKTPHEEYRRRQNEFQAKYDKENTTKITVKMNNRTDKDAIALLSTVDSKQGFIRQLLQEEADRRKEAGTLIVPEDITENGGNDV